MIHHGGRSCYPINADETHAVPCSSCGNELRVRVLVLMGLIRGGVMDRMACACGARWMLEARVAEGVNVYIA